ncbi:unnamed protein product [Psylliodes chrysocephalus]|uniref:CRAL-TRIO domain-containing protein n=1 Tax=Psylliodes chrysocephalus TaxID=3402493 RepID=A0A9P0CSQ8_9CUCU|nr:unnamed protein product [Psylliodes chrysocephala]
MSTILKKIDKNSRKNIFSQYGKTENEVVEDIEMLINWFNVQPHLPEIPTKSMIEFFLVNNKFSIEITKQKLEMYYTIRSLMPEFYEGINPKLLKMRLNFDTSYIFPLPELINDLDRAFLIKFKKVPANEVNIEGFLGKIVNVQEIRIQEDLASRQYVIIDCEHLQLHQALKFTPMHGKIGATILEKVYSNRIKEIHVINFHPIANILLKLAKLVVKPKLLEKVVMHESMETFRKSIPLDVLPKDYGGNEISLDEIQDLWRKKMDEYADRFDILDKLRVNEDKRPDPVKDIDGSGMQGTFKKLNID